jgi:hypothetical protein
LDLAIDILSRAPFFEDKNWLSIAFEVRKAFPLLQIAADPVISLGIPTFFYGHEPPNVFQTHCAKFFANSVREDSLLSMAYNGIVYFVSCFSRYLNRNTNAGNIHVKQPGSAGTVQELFQDGCQNQSV